MAWASTTPAAMDRLVTVFTSADGMPSGAVLDGPVPADLNLTEAVSVGYSGDEAATVEGDLTGEGLTLAPDREQYTVQCAVWVVNGTDDIAAARTRAYELLAVARQALIADHTLGGLVMMARLSSVSLTQSQTAQGAIAQITFGVTVDAFTGR